MKTVFIILNLCGLLVVNTIITTPASLNKGVEIALNGGPFDYPDDPGQVMRSIPAIPVSAFLNDNHSIDLEFHQAMGEVEIIISQNGKVVNSFSGNIISPILMDIQFQELSGDFLLEIKGSCGVYVYGRFTIF